ncbi:MAG: pyridoxal phosphate-dependent aminotransferase [Finegoldia magna]|uniref:Aminotransferase n=1 Tax=Finegoldia magna TaxID=1260 RepID=A0A943L8S5_FINMA|nr:pyridoxal phosphate-dependent aminotransferase [Finegoldia magna]MBS5965662.1 pyridoxal phosphate-dependent aminotransferase [Finegoldia magna]MDU4571291.1 pyridoxal phosphate-dependent aminotransferase [Finegoldia magna]MDU5998336.1 pyridoxal phosphate-dependent aminotransferase [Finegoldia magna]MDU7384770.1 pyridoxal phosphate-dependent aminotransferase [Finegoldia magna]
MKNLSNRATSFTESVIRKMTLVANKYNSINLAQGFPEFDPPVEILNRLQEISLTGPHQYSITCGAKNLREAIAKKHEKLTGNTTNPEENVVVTCGGTEAMMASMMAITNPGDKVIIFSPFYENYKADAILSGAEPIFVKLNPPNFDFDIDELENAFKQNPKAIILCNPSNPSGKVFTREELQIIADFAEKYDTYVVTDEVYEHIVYKPYVHTYFASLPKMKDRTITTTSLSKTYSITGWRLGYTIANKEITQAIKSVHDFLTVGAAAPLQEAAIVGLNFGDEYYEKLQEKYTHKRDIFLNGLKEIGLDFYSPQGTYFVMVDISKFNRKSDYDFCVELSQKIGVTPVPGSSFFKDDNNDYVRFHFAKNDDTLIEAINRLRKINDLFVD